MANPLTFQWECHTCEERVEVGDKYYREGSGEIHHKECFDEWAGEEYRYRFNDYALHEREE